nr:DUF6773 family protein [Tissierella sp.]
MENKEIKDERIIFQRRKIQSEAYSILVYFLLFSILFQQYVLNAPASQYMGEFIGAVGIGIYVAIRNISMGLNLSSRKDTSLKKLFLNSVFLSSITVTFFVFISGERDLVDGLTFFITFTIISFSIDFLLQYLAKKKNKEIDKALNEDEF